MVFASHCIEIFSGSSPLYALLKFKTFMEIVKFA